MTNPISNSVAQHTPGLWELDERYGSLTGNYNGQTIRILDAPDFHECNAQEKAEALADLRRAKVCINALVGIPTEVIEKGYINDILNAAIAWHESHPVTDETKRLSGYLYDRVRRYKQALSAFEGKTNA